MKLDVDQGISQASNSLRQASTKSSNDGKKLEKQDFLNLMMTQMAHQDPLDPMDTDKMMQQVSALGSVEQLQMMNQKLDKIANFQGDMLRSTAYTFLDKDIEVGSNNLQLKGGTINTTSYSLEGNADKVFAYVMNQDGSTVRTIDVGSQGQGTHLLNWDGKDDDGDPLPDGNYKFDVKAKGSGGDSVKANLYKQGRVSSIQFENGRPLVQVNGEYVGLDKIKGLSNVSEKIYDQAVMMPIKKDLPIRGLGTKSPILPRELSGADAANASASLNAQIPAAQTPMEIKRELPPAKLNYPMNGAKVKQVESS